MGENNLAFSKLVATPTPNAWSQAYSAGKLFAALSLENRNSENPEDLAKLGKDLISTLESEFFTLENKDLESIKTAVQTTISRAGENIKSSFIVCYLNDNVLYLFSMGGGKAVLKRGEKIGTVLEADEKTTDVKSASGYVQDEDIIVLQTLQFHKIISSPILATSFDKKAPDEISEELAPHIHERAEGGAAAVVLIYKLGAFEDVPVAATVATTDEQVSEDESLGEAIEHEHETVTTSPGVGEANTDLDNQEIPESIAPIAPEAIEQTVQAPTPPEDSEPIPNLSAPQPTYSQNQTMSTANPENIRPFENQPPPNFNPEFAAKNTGGTSETNESPFLTDMPRSRKRAGFKFPKIGGGKSLSRSKKIIAIVAILIVLLIIIAIVFGILTKSNKQDQAKFNEIYSEANDKYNEGVSLKDLNAPLAKDSFAQAQKILIANKDAFKEGSTEDTQIEDLLTKVNAELGGSDASGETSSATEASKSDSKILAAEIDNTGTFFTQNDDFIYYIDSKGISKIDKGNGKSESIVDKDWKTAGGIGAFGSNIYVLDKSANVLKFAPSGSDFAKSNYFSGTTPDFSSSVGMAIDGSVYVLNKDGSIKKYTRGKEDAFEISGLDKNLSNPTKIYTNENTDNIYVLDNGNSRIVVLGKDGKFVNSYSADVIKNAKDLEANEPGKKIFILSGGKIYKIDLK